MNTSARFLAAAVLCWSGTALAAQQTPKLGYDDTPTLPDSRWRVHSGRRPQRKSVEPGTAGSAPTDAVVLFDGSDLSAWRGRKGDAQWLVKDGAMIVNGSGFIESRQQFGDCQIHLEWSAPLPAKGEGQGRGNSGVYVMGRYEVQVLDSYASRTYPDGQAGALYGQTPPLVNACRPPGEWQSYDIIFRAPRFRDGQMSEPAVATVLHNGVLLHHHRAFVGQAAWRKLAKYAEHPAKGPLRLQDHGNPVRFRNVWVRELEPYPGDAPQVSTVDLDGLRQALAAYRGRPLLVNFWAMGCVPSVQDLPALHAARAAVVAGGGDVVGVAMDLTAEGHSREQVEAALPEFLSKRGLDLSVLLYTGGDLRAVAEAFDLSGSLPSTLAINAAGEVVAVHAGQATAEQFAALVAAALERR